MPLIPKIPLTPIRTPTGTTAPGATAPAPAPTAPIVTGPMLPGPVIRPPAPPSIPPGVTDWKTDIYVPSNLGHPPTSNDVVVRKGFDGRTPEEAYKLVRANIQNPVYAQNEGFLKEHIIQAHKMFTVAVNNAFIAGSPFQVFARSMPGARFTILGTPSIMNPTFVQVDQPGKPTRYFERGPLGYEEVPKLQYQVIMRAAVRITVPQGVAVDYPPWKNNALSGPTCTITELR